MESASFMTINPSAARCPRQQRNVYGGKRLPFLWNCVSGTAISNYKKTPSKKQAMSGGMKQRSLPNLNSTWVYRIGRNLDQKRKGDSHVVQ